MKILKRLPYLALLLVVPLMMGPTAGAEHYVHIVRGHDYNVPPQPVVIDGQPLLFEADIHLCRNGQAKEFGFVEMSSPDGVELRLVPVAGYRLREERGAVLLVLVVAAIDRDEVLPEQAVAIVRPIAGSPGVQSWDLKLGRTSAVFDVEGTIDTRPDGGRCEPVDFGQLQIALAEIDVPPQPVDGPGDIIGMESSLMIRGDNQARGFIDFYPVRQPPLTYQAFHGAAFRDPDTGLFSAQFVLLLVDPPSADPLSTDADILLATVKEDASQPDCLIWDLINGTSGQANGVVQTTGRIRVVVYRK